jgi:hypothetical protein
MTDQLSGVIRFELPRGYTLVPRGPGVAPLLAIVGGAIAWAYVIANKNGRWIPVSYGPVLVVGGLALLYGILNLGTWLANFRSEKVVCAGKKPVGLLALLPLLEDPAAYLAAGETRPVRRFTHESGVDALEVESDDCRQTLLLGPGVNLYVETVTEIPELERLLSSIRFASSFTSGRRPGP